MIDVKQAVQLAFKYFADLYQGAPQNLALEEVELTEDQKFWNITVGFNQPGTSPLVQRVTRDYKVMRINADNGELVSMKIRSPLPTP